jgi:hypothetical protein
LTIGTVLVASLAARIASGPIAISAKPCITSGSPTPLSYDEIAPLNEAKIRELRQRHASRKLKR